MTVSKLILKIASQAVVGGALLCSLAGFSVGSSAVAWGSESELLPIAPIVEDNHSRSIFDQLFASRGPDGLIYDVPFPFTSLVSEIEQHLGNSINDEPNEVKLALFPLSRCVNRYAADPDFYKFPRIVLAVDSEEVGAGFQQNLFLKDQLFVGYQQQAQSLEIISYNNEEGKFEFQVVSDYSETGQPKVSDAKRQNCIVCHQNQGPIFPRANWNETDNNRSVFNAIAAAQGFFNQNITPVSRLRASAVNGAITRANMFPLHQKLWQRGCQSDAQQDGILCRAALFETVMLDQLAEAYRRQTPSAQVSRYLIETSKKNIARYWPQGIRLPSSALPSENPLMKENLTYLNSAIQLEQTRANTIHWRPNDLYRVIKGLGGMVAKSDILKMDQILDRISDAKQAGTENREGDCRITVTRSSDEPAYKNLFNGDVAAECHWKGDGISEELNLLGDLYVEQGRVHSPSGLNSVVLGGRGFLVKFAHQGGEIVSSNGRSRIQLVLSDSKGKLRARLPNGRTIESIDINWDDHLANTDSPDDAIMAKGEAVLKIKSNSRILEKAISELANTDNSSDSNVFSNKPFNGQKIMATLLSTLEAMERMATIQSSELSAVLPAELAGP